MLEAWDWFNVIGIFLEIVGFILLLSRFIKWISAKFENMYKKGMDDWIKKVNDDLLNAPKTPWIYRIFRGNEHTKTTEEIGIGLVITGLIFQLVSVLVGKSVT